MKNWQRILIKILVILFIIFILGIIFNGLELLYLDFIRDIGG